MNWGNLTAKDFSRVITKLSLEPSGSPNRRAPHAVYWYMLNGQKTLRITLPNTHGGSGSISTGFLQQIKKSFWLNTRQFENLVECPLMPDEFEKIIREKISGEKSPDS
jgi:hypothetical protein